MHTNPTIHSIAQFAQTLATQAGKFLRAQYTAQADSNLHQRTSPKAMKLAEDSTMDEWLVSRIMNEFPDHTILTEESGEHQAKAVSDDGTVRWIIDPIDGSVNFSIHNPFVAISLAVEIDGVIEVGVIEAPLLGEQFMAVRNQGATLNGSPIHVSNTQELSNAYLVSCDGGMTDRVEVFSTLIRSYYDQVKDFRKLGSAALECAWVACGRADGYVTMQIDPWDVAAGVLLVQEAGGQVSNFQGQTWTAKKTDLLCSNGHIHQAMQDRLWG